MRQETEPDEAFARLTYYLPWIYSGRRVEELAPRLYVLISQLFPPEQFLTLFEQVWADVEHRYRVQFDAIATQSAPAYFGRDAYWRDANAKRERALDSMREAVLDQWRSGGRDAEDARMEFSDIEAGIKAITEMAIRRPRAHDQKLIEKAREAVVKRSLANPAVARKFTATQLTEWARTAIHAELVSEARRRAATSPVARVLDETAARMRAEGASEQEIKVARRDLADTLLARK